MFGKILSSTVNIFAYEFRVYSYLYVIKYIIVNDCFGHLCGVILALKNSGCDNSIFLQKKDKNRIFLKKIMYFLLHFVLNRASISEKDLKNGFQHDIK